MLVLAAALLVRPGVLLPVAAPCAAAPGSTLVGFPDGVRGPIDVTAVLAAASSPPTPPVGVRACLYGSPGVRWGQETPPGGHGVRVVELPRAAVEGDPVWREQVRTSVAEQTTPRWGGRSVVLPRTGLTAVVRSTAGENATQTDVVCRSESAYHRVEVGSSGAAMDHVGALDALAAAMGCEPIGAI